jgi:hypothetical protein
MSIRHASAPPTPPAAADPDTPSDAERRAALAKLGALAAWTAPTMLTLMTSARAEDFGSPTRPS